MALHNSPGWPASLLMVLLVPVPPAMFLAAPLRAAQPQGLPEFPSPELLPRPERRVAAALRFDDWERVRSLPALSELRVSLKGARVLRGKLVGVTDDSLTLRLVPKELRTEPRSEVVRIRLLHRDSLADGTVYGLWAGGGVGALVGAVVGGPGDDRTEERRFGGILGFAIGAGIGAVAGAAVDAGRVQYTLIYETLPQETAREGDGR